ncbi:MAG: ATP-binding protein [Campylobacterota bacterium]|nr:ATP-binding protein [Campylobacterota bacterium]
MKIVLLLFITIYTLFASPERKIILGSAIDVPSAKKAFERFHSRIDDNFLGLQQQYGFNIVARSSGDSYIIVLEPFRNYKEAKAVKKQLPNAYDDAFINKYSVSKGLIIVATTKIETPKIIETTTSKEAPELTTEVNTTAIEKTTMENSVVLPQQTLPELAPNIEEERNISESISIEDVKQKVKKSVTPIEIKATQTHSKGGNALIYITIALALILIPLIAITLKLYQDIKKLKTALLNTEEDFHSCFHDKEDLLATLESKDSFLDNLTFSLKNSIDSILSSLYILDNAKLNRKEYESYENIIASISKINEVINNIIDITKLQSNSLELENIKFNLNNILETTANSIHKQAQEKRIEITFDIDTLLPIRFMGDPLRMNQILTNILNHSILNTQEGEIVISVKEKKRTTDTIELQFTIKDTGVGYKKDEARALFENLSETSGYSVDSNVKIGLVMSKHLINKMGGDIELKSSYGHGSSFIFNVILELPKKMEQRKYRLPYKKIMEYSTIIIDNNVLAARVLRQQLEYFHLKVKPSFSWEHAVKLIEDEFSQIDFIIINSTILGEASIEELSSTAEKRGLQIVFIVHDMRDINYQVIEKFKFSHFLHKPYTQKKLFDLLVKIHENNLKAQS